MKRYIRSNESPFLRLGPGRTRPKELKEQGYKFVTIAWPDDNDVDLRTFRNELKKEYPGCVFLKVGKYCYEVWSKS